MKYLTILFAAFFTTASINLLINKKRIKDFNKALQELEETSKRTNQLTCEIEQEIDECWALIQDYKNETFHIK